MCYNSDDHLPLNLNSHGRSFPRIAHSGSRHHSRTHVIPLLRILRLRIHAALHRLSGRNPAFPAPRQRSCRHTYNRLAGLLLQPICQPRGIFSASVEILQYLRRLSGYCSRLGLLLLPRDARKVSGRSGSDL